MVTNGIMILAWVCAGVALGFLTAYVLVSKLEQRERQEKIRALAVENEALKRTNGIYRERIDQLEDALFSNKKYREMAREIERLSAGNYKLRSKLRDLECLVEAERKRNTRERVEYLEKRVRELQEQLEEKSGYRTETLIPVEVLPAGSEVAVTVDSNYFKNNEREEKSRKGWSTITLARKL